MISFPALLRRPAAWAVAGLVLALPFLAGCDDGTLNEPDVSDDTFESYVALGNSLTAGFQSNGINKTVQQQSYAVRLAGQMNTPFNTPTIPDPGCPPPLENILTGTPVGEVDGGCTLRETPTPTTVHNVAVPGAKVIDALTNLSDDSSPNTLTTLMLGGRTQLGAARDANPSFATVWLGNNDVLGAALAGNTNLITPQQTFESRYTSVLDSLEDMGVEGGAIASVANVTFIPNLSPAPAYAGAESAINQFGQLAATNLNATWGSFTVNGNCAGTASSTRVPFQYAFGGLFAIALTGQDVELDCSDNRTLREIYGPQTLAALDIAPLGNLSLLTGPEATEVVNALNDYNAFLQEEANDRGWAYVNVNAALGALYAAGTETQDPTDDLVPKFPPLINSVQEADVSTFGRFFSEDGVHPTGATHRIVTNRFIQAINSTYDTSLEPIEAPEIPSPQQ